MANSRELVACHLIHDLGRGGAESVLVDLAHVAGEAGLDLRVISLMPLGDHRYPGMLRERGVAVSSLELAGRWDPRGYRRVVAEVRRLAPDVIHTHLKHADILGAHAARRLEIPMVSTLHMIEDAPGPVGRVKRRAGARARLRTARYTIAVSEAQRSWYLEAFGADPAGVVTIPNGVVDPSGHASSDVRGELGIPPDAVVAATIGIMRPGKGHTELLEAAARMPPESEIWFLLAGDGELRPRLEAQAAELRDRVVFAGFREDVPAVVRAADLLIHPSLFDALPTALIHGLAAGVPAVASAVGGIPEIVTPECGVLVPPGNPNALATAVAELAADSGRRNAMGAAARRRFEAEFDARRWADRLKELYRKAAA